MDENHSEQNGESMDICGIDGRHSDLVTKGELNLFIRRVKIFHLRPLSTKVDQMHNALFNEEIGIVPLLKNLQTLRRWIGIAAMFCASLVLGGIALIDRLIAHGWWFK